MVDKIEIVNPGINDFSEIFPLLRQLWPNESLNNKLDEDKMKKVFQIGLNSPNQYFLIAKYSDRIVGYVSLTIKNDLWQGGNLGQIDELVVDREFRRKGIGSKLMDEMIKEAKNRLCKEAELISGFDRKEAQEYHVSQGFQRKAYVFRKKI